MRKILKVIESCHDCNYCKSFLSQKDNYTATKVCDFASDTESKIHSPFLLKLTTSKGLTQLLIPENCPLEDYTETKTDC